MVFGGGLASYVAFIVVCCDLLSVSREMFQAVRVATFSTLTGHLRHIALEEVKITCNTCLLGSWVQQKILIPSASCHTNWCTAVCHAMEGSSVEALPCMRTS